jgi:hypothetical protein
VSSGSPGAEGSNGAGHRLASAQVRPLESRRRQTIGVNAVIQKEWDAYGSTDMHTAHIPTLK